MGFSGQISAEENQGGFVSQPKKMDTVFWYVLDILQHRLLSKEKNNRWLILWQR